MSDYITEVLFVPGVAAFWTFDETSGTVAVDVKGTADLTIAGGVTLGSAPLVAGGTASATFSRAGLGRASKATSYPSGPFAVECWVRCDDPSVVDQSIWFNGSGGNGHGLMVGKGGGIPGRLYLLAEGMFYHDLGYTLDAGVHHIYLGRAAGTDECKLIVDGVVVSSVNRNFGATPSGGFVVGAKDAGGGNGFIGAIDEVAVYAVTLDEADVVAHHTIGVGFEAGERVKSVYFANIATRHSGGSNPYTYRPGAPSTDAEEHYDPGCCFMNDRDLYRFRGVEPLDWGESIDRGIRMWRDEYVLKLPPGDQPAPWHRQTHGLCRHYLESGNADSLRALDVVIPQYVYNVNSPADAAYVDQFRYPYLQRENSFILTGMVDRVRAGLPAHSTEAMLMMVDWGLEMIDHFSRPWDQRYGVFNRAFMFGLMLRSLVYYWFTFRADPDAAIQARIALIPPAIEQAVRFAHAELWWPYGVNKAIAFSGFYWHFGGIKYVWPAGDAASHVGLGPFTITSVAAGATRFTASGTPSTIDDYYKYLHVGHASTVGFHAIVRDYDGTSKEFRIQGVFGTPNFTVGSTITLHAIGGDDGAGGNARDDSMPVGNPLVSPAMGFAFWHRTFVLGDPEGAAEFLAMHDEFWSGQTAEYGPTYSVKEQNESTLWGANGLGYIEAALDPAGPRDTDYDPFATEALPGSTVAVALTLRAAASATKAAGVVPSRAAAAALRLTATASARAAFARAGPTILTLAAVARAAIEGEPAEYARAASATLLLTATGSERGSLALLASTSFVLSSSAAFSTGVATQPPGGYIGRYQLGQEVPFLVQCRDAAGRPAAPAAPPTARVYRDGVPLRAVELSHDEDTEVPGRFRGRLRLADGDAPGRHAVVYLYGVGVEVVVGSDTFEVAPGGDPQGPVLAGFVLSRPDADVVMAHLGSGRLAAGRTPYLDEGV